MLSSMQALCNNDIMVHRFGFRRGESDMQIRAMDGQVVITKYSTATKYELAEATDTTFAQSDVKLGLEIFVTRIFVESTFTASGQRSAWLLFLTDPQKQKPFFSLQKTFDQDKTLAFEMGSTLLEVSWSFTVLRDVPNHMPTLQCADFYCR